MPRFCCPGCNQFVSLENGDVTVDNTSYESGVVNMNFRLTRVCVNCGEELKEAYLEYEIELKDPVPPDTLCDWDIEIDESAIEVVEHPKGKGRGYRTFIGTQGSGTLIGTDNGKDVSFEFSWGFEDANETASGFDVL